MLSIGATDETDGEGFLLGGLMVGIFRGIRATCGSSDLIHQAGVVQVNAYLFEYANLVEEYLIVSLQRLVFTLSERIEPFLDVADGIPEVATFLKVYVINFIMFRRAMPSCWAASKSGCDFKRFSSPSVH